MVHRPNMSDATIVGRRVEVAAIEHFLDALSDGSRVLLIEGEPGIGKTTLVQTAARLARGRGYLVLAAAPAESEMPLDFAGLADLLAAVPARFIEALPRPQRDAVLVSVLRTEQPTVAPDSRTIATAIVGLVRDLAGKQPVLVLIDDIHWLDTPSAEAVAFMLRRVGSSPVGLIGAVRTDWTGGLPPLMTDRIPADEVAHLRLGPLSLGATAELLASRSIAMSKATLMSLHDRCRGNPLFALELARASAGWREPADQSGVPALLRRFVSQRVTALSSQARRFLLTVALGEDLPLGAVLAAVPDQGVAALEEAIDSGLLEHSQDGPAFAHPLMRSVVIEAAPHADRRSVHRWLAGVTPSAEQRAWHLALGATLPDESVADEVEAAARSARIRGAGMTAAQLAELAVSLTPLPQLASRRRRSLLAAECHLQASRPARAAQVIADVIKEMPAGPDRAQLLCRQAVYLSCGDDLAGAARQRDAALQEAGADDVALRAVLHRDTCWAHINGGDLAAAARAIEAALAYASKAGDPAVVAQVSAAKAMVTFLIGGGVCQELIEAALAGPSAPPTLQMGERPAVALGAVLHLSDDLDGARALYEQEYASALETGIETNLPALLWAMIETEVWAGNWDRAEELVHHGAELAAESNGPSVMAMMTAAEARLYAHRGHLQLAREKARQAAELASQSGAVWPGMTAAETIGLIELSAGDAQAAHEALAPFTEMAISAGVAEPGLWCFLPDEIEALVRLGELDQADALLEPFEARSQQLGRWRGIATAGRCQGLILAARGDLSSAEAALEAALVAHRKIPFPFEEARTLLVAGQVHRRARHKGEAGRCLRAAAETFERLGSPIWASLARAELSRVGLRTSGTGSADTSLTSTESQVADLVASGCTNAEVAAKLFMGRRTVESHLSRIYRKLDVRSRTELVRTLTASGADASPDSWARAHRSRAAGTN